MSLHIGGQLGIITSPTVRRFKTTRLATLKPSTRITYTERLKGEVALTAKGKPWRESGLNQSFQRARDRAQRDVWSFHDTRHFFVSELFRRGAPAHVIQALARHSDLKTTQRYADLDVNDLRAAIDLLQVDGNRRNADASE